MLVHILEQFPQIEAFISIEYQILARTVDEVRSLGVVPKVIVNDIALAKVLNVLAGVHQAVQKNSVNCEVLLASLVALLECHTVQQQTSHQVVDGYVWHLNHSSLEFHF
ncbi:hypothetical protein F2P56_033997 [Juglans regia]|uniref:Uncharacterized protein n=1 Tax=Juglans regia TaxID=51240 RepID=A0A833T901_JUGRE|nr:hypothetical protein F2P56_033997 [Juglans regia]